MDLFDSNFDDEFNIFPYKEGYGFSPFLEDQQQANMAKNPQPPSSSKSPSLPQIQNNNNNNNNMNFNNNNNSAIKDSNQNLILKSDPILKSCDSLPVVQAPISPQTQIQQKSFESPSGYTPPIPLNSNPTTPPSVNNNNSTTSTTSNANANTNTNNNNSTSKKRNEKQSEGSILFEKALHDQSLKFNPIALGFIPTTFWSNTDYNFGEIVTTFFQRKNNSKCRFPHKLYNALIFSHMDPKMFDLVGVKWIDDKILLINQCVFARLLGIKAIEGSLFHQQGNFPSHGFIEIDPSIVKQMDPNFDFTKNRLLTHSEGIFVRGCTEKQIASCKWQIINALTTPNNSSNLSISTTNK